MMASTSTTPLSPTNPSTTTNYSSSFTTAPSSYPSSSTTTATTPAPAHPASILYHPPRRLLIFHETRNPQNPTETAYVAVNAQGLPICGGPGLEFFSKPVSSGLSGAGGGSVLDLPLRVIKAFTEIFNNPRYKNWAIVSAGPYHDPSEEGKFYAVVLEQVREQTQGGVGQAVKS
ncbi:hypothetical protein VTN77DRAFT_4401 [Rasamsonia byssochlamydoides]|uniref:uncharacterized protein n=1 Tax=Rasamsonia byssochlamydoides TaxID=89139 RepID=UPI0037449DDD